MSDELDRTDDFSYYINAYAAAFDPHTQYFPPQQQEAFEIEMTGQLEGIGAQLQQDGEFVTIASIVTGSACWRQGELEVGDKLLKVAQGDAQPEDVVGMRVNKVVTKVRGKKGTEVRLTVRKKDGTEKVIPIVRDIVDDVRDRDVLLVDDILESGFTLSFAKKLLEERGARRVSICTLLDKPEKRRTTLQASPWPRCAWRQDSNSTRQATGLS